MFKRVVVTAFLGGALLFTIPNAAQANGRPDGSYGRLRHDHPGAAEALWHFRGAYRAPDLYFVHPGVGTAGYFPGYPAPAYVADIVDDDYYVVYGFRCNGYRDGYYYDRDDRPWNRDGAAYFHRNADCDDFYARHGYWYGVPVCDRYDEQSGYCDR